MDSKQVINEILSVLGLTANALAKSLGVSPQTIYDIINGKTGNGLSRSLTSKISKTYPYINEAFLLTGEGEIILDKSIRSKSINIEDALDRISKAVLNNSEANKLNSEANKVNADAFNRLTINMERIIDLLEYKIKEE